MSCRENSDWLHPPPAPASFQPAGRVLSASLSLPPALRKRKYTGRRLQGVRYERRVHEYLASLYGDGYVASPWLKFFAEGRWRWCQPDGLVLAPATGRITVVEVKYQHTSDAWWQLRHLYLPVLAQIFPPALWRFDVCEVVKWYDPAVVFPERVVLAHEPALDNSAFKIHIYRG